MKVRPTHAPLLVAALAGSLALALLAAGCPQPDLCAQAPLCQENRAVNCEPSCPVGPCSNGPRIHDCGTAAQCNLYPGDLNSDRFFRARALCVLNGTDVCDPALAPPPTCDGLGNITGCSAYKRVIETGCTQANLYFTNYDCCSQPWDAGAPPDGGVSDGGLDGGDGGA